MSMKKTLTTLSIVGTAFAAGLAASNVALAKDAGANPFAMNELSSGYMQVAKEGKCGEGKCGGMKKDSTEGKCGDSMKKGAKEGKCGEGKCGDSMKGKKEGKCGDSVKGKKEGKCGEGKCGSK